MPPKDFSIKEAIKKVSEYKTVSIYELGKAYFLGWDTDKDFIKASELCRGAEAWNEEIEPLKRIKYILYIIQSKVFF